MTEDPNKVVYFAETDARNRRMRFGIKNKDRSRHMYVIGKTGMGKSTLLENLAIQDMQSGRGLIFIDPHGKTADLLLEYVPEERLKDVLYFAPFDLDFPVSFNVMEDVGADKRHLVAAGLMAAFKKIWVDAWSARMEYILNNILLALLEYPNSTLIGVNRMLADEDYRKKVTEYVTDPGVKSFWNDEFAKYGPRYMQEAGAAIQNKIGQFISNPLIRNIIGQPKSTFDLRDMIDNSKIIVINLSKGRVGEANANLLGAMLITKIYLAAMSRADLPESELEKLPNAYLYVDEFQNFANESFADILSEARKYKLNLTVAHQYIEQMTEEVRAAVFGNVGTMISFRVGAFDAEVLEKEYGPEFTAQDMVSLGFAQVYLKLMIDGVSSRPFSATTLAPIAKPEKSFRDQIIANSREVFSRTRVDVENEIKGWHEEMQAASNAQYAEQKAKKGRLSPIDQAVYAVTGKAPVPLPKAADVPEEVKKDPAYTRERDLRKAVSLSYLRQNHAKPKEKKSPTPEHLADLRAALASITGDVVQDIIRTPNTEPIFPDGEDHDVNDEIAHDEALKANEEQISYTPAPKVEHLQRDEAPKHPPEAPKEVKETKEVPEDVLKKILEIE